MPKATFIGDPNDDFSGPKSLVMGAGKTLNDGSKTPPWNGYPVEGVAFEIDKAVKVTEEQAVKLRTNPHFKVEEDKASKGGSGETPPPAADTAPE